MWKADSFIDVAVSSVGASNKVAFEVEATKKEKNKDAAEEDIQWREERVGPVSEDVKRQGGAVKTAGGRCEGRPAGGSR